MLPNKSYWAVIKSLKKNPQNWKIPYLYWMYNGKTAIWMGNGWPFVEIQTYGKNSWNGGWFGAINPFNLYLWLLARKALNPTVPIQLND